MFDIENFKTGPDKHNRYEKHIGKLRSEQKETSCISEAVDNAINNINQGQARSFVIYGEPQSGKTEMMIGLTGRLLDEGHKIIVVLLNDSIQLLNQNLDRFRRSGIDPTPKNYAELLDPSIIIGENEWVIFSKKNQRDLTKLNEKLRKIKQIVVIDDEADYASPNAKVNKGERTKINRLIHELLGKSGIYIGVTATPARLDLNNTFENDNEKWVDFPAHPYYVGQDIFFPLENVDLNNLKFKLNLLPEQNDSPKFLREALFRFFINVAYLNTQINEPENNYSILIHTSGKKADHSIDYQVVIKTFNELKNQNGKKFETHIKKIWELAEQQYPNKGDTITQYIVSNLSRHTIVVMNSDIDKKVVDFNSATNPSAVFTVAIGGNIVSRGVTFDNLLSMFFTRDVKTKIQQDTYIQRARMFGSRGIYLKYFELSIPGNLYYDWHKCFVFHKLALSAIRKGNGSPVWLEDSRVSSAAASSIDRTTVDMDKGEMAFERFLYDPEIENMISKNIPSFERLEKLAQHLGDNKLPKYLIEFIRNFSPKKDASLAIHPTRGISNYHDADQEKIERKKGFIGKSDREEDKYPHAVHHLKIYKNDNDKARVFYKYVGNIKFLKNLKGLKND